MSLLADALQPLLPSGMLSLSGRMAPISLPDLITRRGAAYDLGVDAPNEAVLLDFRDPRVILEALASDLCRSSSASFQSVAEIAPYVEDKSTLPWALIKLYYAAYYAGHAVIRLLGESCSYFAPSHVRRISEVAASVGGALPFRLSAGFFHCVLDPSSSAISCRQSRGLVGGAHEAFWGVFGTKINELAEAVLRGPLEPRESQEVYAQLDALRQIMHPGNGHSWLSFVRNEVQYRNQYGVWFPPEHKAAQRGALARLASGWMADPMRFNLSQHPSDLHAFVNGCAFIIAVCRVLVVRVFERSSAGARTRPFVEYGPISLLRHMNVHR